MSQSEKAIEYRHIITKAVCGKGRKFSQVSHALKPSTPIHTILGAWVINHKYECHKVGEAVEVQGTYDINIWVSAKGNTKTDVIKETVSYTEQVPLNYYDQHTRDTSVAVSTAVTQVPNCVEASIASNSEGINIRVEKEFQVELVGETKICVPVYPMELANTDEKDYVSEYVGDEADDFEHLDGDIILDDLTD
ncbi:outer spore coat protein CotE [Hazenella sp. IB182357]|uniref:Outer spore coat protein CotE n=1 Tax=Polycladospora coralii TaxID=2771432 RepID=A0A926RUG5_9BACL|nr:outer spore coat protein CotE [Polycladospora coralii]MBD1372943.1 outer spore coat protein CotE [Polycladospora coralii]MBS7531000.1 outer spore coat protein CotE [Polycladospora coralii]